VTLLRRHGEFVQHGNTLLADASDLGLAPGEVAGDQVSVLFEDGHVEHYRWERNIYNGTTGDLDGWRYYQSRPFNRFVHLVIAND
jgi:hypothetical protein